MNYLGTLKSWCELFGFDNSYANPLCEVNNAKLYINDEEVTEVKELDGLTKIPDDAFRGCTGITSITIPDSVTSIGNSAFAYCTGITSVIIPNSVQIMGDWAFFNCTGLTEITIPNSVTSIGDYTFDSCTGLTSITIPDSVKSIGDYAFYECTGLQTIVIGAGVTSIGNYAFYGCEGLQTVYYEGTSEQWNDISIGEYQNSSFINAKRYYFSGQDPYQNGTAVEDEEYWHWNEEHTAPEVWAKQD